MCVAIATKAARATSNIRSPPGYAISSALLRGNALRFRSIEDVADAQREDVGLGQSLPAQRGPDFAGFLARDRTRKSRL
jgi:hypothetical protein